MITYKHGFHKGGDFVLSKKNFSYIAKKIRTFATLSQVPQLAGPAHIENRAQIHICNFLKYSRLIYNYRPICRDIVIKYCKFQIGTY